MNEENTNYFLKTYPDLFQYCKHFECGDGWFKIIDDLARKITSRPKWPEISFKASEVKEKYGTLRFCLDTETDEIEKFIEQAEAQSAKICEICGKPGSIDTAMVWYSCRCKECRNPKSKV